MSLNNNFHLNDNHNQIKKVGYSNWSIFFKIDIKRLLIILVGLVIFFFFILLLSGKNAEASDTFYVGGTGPDNYTKINDAIIDSNDGDTIFVYNGLYQENVIIDKQLNLTGEDKNTTFISTPDFHVGSCITISGCSRVNIDNFTIGAGYYGIYISSSEYLSIINIKIINNYYAGLYIINSNYNEFKYINIENNEYGLYIRSSCRDNDFNNITCQKNGRGIYMIDFCRYNIFQYNDIKSNWAGGIHIYSSYNNKFSNNTIQLNSMGIIGGCGIQLVKSGNTYEYNEIHSNDGSGIIAYNSYSDKINNNIIGNNTEWGIFIINSTTAIYPGNNFKFDGKSNKLGQVCVEWLVDISILDYLDNPIPGANILIEDRFNTVVKNIVTDIYGKVLESNLTEYKIFNDDSNKTFNPYIIYVEKSGYKNQTTVIVDSYKSITIKINEIIYFVNDLIIEETMSFINKTIFFNNSIIIKNEGNILFENTTIILNGNLIIEDGGFLTFKNTTLMVNCSINGEFYIEVQAGGKLYIYDYDNNNTTMDDASNITAFNTNYRYLFYIKKDAIVEIKNSILQYCGYDWYDSGLIIESDNVLIQNNQILDNHYGLKIIYCNPTIIENEIFNNIGYGVYYYFSNGTIKNNTIYKNNNMGIICNNSSPKIENNDIFENYAGICAGYNCTSPIINNEIYNNRWGIYTYCNEIIVKNNAIFDNIDGIFCHKYGNPKIIENNISNNNLGIRCSYSNPKIENNTLENNNLGIKCSYSNPKIENNTLENNDFGFDIPYHSKETIPKMFDNIVNGEDIQKCYWYNISNKKIYSLIFDSGRSNGYTGNLTYQGLITLYDCKDIKFINCNFSNNNYGIYTYSSNGKIVNSSIANSLQRDFFLNNSQIVTLNTTFSKIKPHFDDFVSNLTVQWFLSIMVKNQTNEPIKIANVIVTDKNEIEIIRNFTNKEGWLKWVICNEYTENFTSKTDYSPYNIQAEIYGISKYFDYPVNLTKNRIVSIFLNIIIDVTVENEDISFSGWNHDGNPIVGDKITIKAIIYNIGNVNITSSMATFHLNEKNGIQIGKTQIISSQQSGKNQSVNITWKDTDKYFGNIKIWINILNSDPEETITINNYAFKTIYIISKPDLCIEPSGITFYPYVPKEGDKVVVRTKIKNLGEADVTGKLIFYYDELNNPKYQIGNKIVSVDNNSVNNVSIEWKAIFGAHKIYVKITNSIPGESNLDNNIAYIDIFIYSYLCIFERPKKFDIELGGNETKVISVKCIGRSVKNVYLETEKTQIINLLHIQIDIKPKKQDIGFNETLTFNITISILEKNNNSLNKTKYLFSLASEYKQFLLNGSVNEELRLAFKNKKCIISDNAKIYKIDDKMVGIIDGNKTYFVNVTNGQIDVFKTPIIIITAKGNNSIGNPTAIVIFIKEKDIQKKTSEDKTSHAKAIIIIVGIIGTVGLLGFFSTDVGKYKLLFLLVLLLSFNYSKLEEDKKVKKASRLCTITVDIHNYLHRKLKASLREIKDEFKEKKYSGREIFKACYYLTNDKYYDDFIKNFYNGVDLLPRIERRIIKGKRLKYELGVKSENYKILDIFDQIIHLKKISSFFEKFTYKELIPFIIVVKHNVPDVYTEFHNTMKERKNISKKDFENKLEYVWLKFIHDSEKREKYGIIRSHLEAELLRLSAVYFSKKPAEPMVKRIVNQYDLVVPIGVLGEPTGKKPNPRLFLDVSRLEELGVTIDNYAIFYPYIQD